jgi:hypothetical protein
MYSGECWFTLTLGMLPFYAPKWDKRRTLGVVLLALILQMIICYDVSYNGGTGFGVQFQHFSQAFSTLEM